MLMRIAIKPGMRNPNVFNLVVYKLISLVALGNLDLDFKLVNAKCFNFKSIDFRCYFKFNDFIYQIQILDIFKIFKQNIWILIIQV